MSFAVDTGNGVEGLDAAGVIKSALDQHAVPIRW